MSKLMCVCARRTLAVAALLLFASQGAAWGQASGGLVNVSGYGAQGDGVTDDTAAIQAAIDDLPEAGGLVLVPPGTHVVRTIHLRSGVSLIGTGGGSILKAGPKTGAILAFAPGKQSRIRVADLVLDGGKDQETKSDPGLSVRGGPVSELVVERVTFQNNKSRAILIGGDQRDLMFRDIRIVDTDGTAVEIHGGKDIWFDRAVILNPGGKSNGRAHGIYTTYKSNVHNLSITNCRIEGAGHHNIFLGDASEVRIENNYIHYSGRIDGSGSGIQANRAYAKSMRGLLIRGNTFESSQGYAICTSGVNEFVVSGNRVVGGADPAMRIQGDGDEPSNFMVSNNLFLRVRSMGVVVVGDPAHSHNATISGNVFRDCLMSPLVISGGKDITITGNTILDNGTAWAKGKPDAESYAGILLGSASHIVITGNRIGNTTGKATQSYGVYEAANCDHNTISNNDLTNNAAGAYRKIGAHTVVSSNRGVEE